jgi:hypothetical protein
VNLHEGAFDEFMELVRRYYPHRGIVVDYAEFLTVLKRTSSYYETLPHHRLSPGAPVETGSAHSIDDAQPEYVGPQGHKEAVYNAVMHMKNTYRDAPHIVDKHTELSGDKVDWSTMRRLAHSFDRGSIWAVALRMAHESGDYGKVESYRREEAQRREALEHAMYPELFPKDTGVV